MKRKSLTILIAVVLVVVCAIGGTLAWLTAQTQEVTNTFTVGNIDITLTETGAIDTDNDEFVDSKSYSMVPGTVLDKDPKITVAGGSEKCYLFVKVDKSTTLDTYIAYTIDSGWKNVPNADGVYYQIVNKNAGNRDFGVLANDTVTVKNTVTKDNMDYLNTDEAIQPTLSFKAYDVQYDNIYDATKSEDENAAVAWVKAQTDGSN